MASILKASLIILWTLSHGLKRQVGASLIPNGTNVCTKQESFAQGYTVSVQQSLNKKVTYKCRSQQQWLFLYKTCYKNTVVYQVGYKQLYRAAYRILYVCCDGWKPTGTSCTAPICSQRCYNGTCNKPNVCTCLPGYHGAACDRRCQLNRWGPGCTNTCQCKNNATCDMRNGSCSCLPGWKGRTCDQPCDQGYYGNNCLQTCTCRNGANCDHVTGDCTCSPGWQGQQCNVSCSPGHYGNRCQQTCKCRNNAKCNHVTGDCLCARGFQGTFCERPCSSGYYGEQCQEECQCKHGFCDYVNGTCTCRVGYKGPRCKEACSSGTYGINCSRNCSCPQNTYCNPIDGSCTCKKGFTGESCEKCQSGYYGNNCQSKCSCHSDELCDPFDGNCTCKEDKCNERTKSSKSKQTGDSSGPLLPATISAVVIVIVIAIVIACFVFLKRRNQRMRNETKDKEPVNEFSDENGKKHKENFQLVRKELKPTYMELAGVSKNNSHKHINDGGIQNPAYQKLTSKESRGSYATDVTMETQYAGLDSHKKLDSVYQPLQRETLTRRNSREKQTGESAYQSLSKPNKDSYHVKCNPAYESESPALYENYASKSRENVGEGDSTYNSDTLYLKVLSDKDQASICAMSDQPTYEILPTTVNDNLPIYCNQ